jgi:hypothetical protein
MCAFESVFPDCRFNSDVIALSMPFHGFSGLDRDHALWYGRCRYRASPRRNREGQYVEEICFGLICDLDADGIDSCDDTAEFFPQSCAFFHLL